MDLHRFANKCIKHINIIYHRLLNISITIIERLYIWLIGIKIGRGIDCFRGWTSFFMADESRIIIGNNCKFNSSCFQNHIGLNHRCILATYNKNSEIIIGNNVGMSSSTINAWNSIRIGNNVRIGANCVVMDSDFHIDDNRVGNPKPIKIDDNVWLGANVVVMKGVHIGKNSVIGMNSVVTKDIPNNCIAAGSPCKVVKML